MISVAVQIVGMKATRARPKESGPSAASMKGRRRPIGVWKVSLHGPMTSGSVSAKKPSAAITDAISVAELVKCLRSGGRYARVVVIENASPNAPSPRLQTALRWGGTSGSSSNAAEVLGRWHQAMQGRRERPYGCIWARPRTPQRAACRRARSRHALPEGALAARGRGPDGGAPVRRGVLRRPALVEARVARERERDEGRA